MGTVGEVSENRGEFAVEWRIKEFFSLPSEIGKFYYSSVFSFAGASWKMMIYPNGRKKCPIDGEGNKNTKGLVGLYLYRTTPGPPILLEYSLGSKILDGKVNPEWHCTYNFNGINGYGFGKFLNRSKLLENESELVPSGVLTVVCKIKYPKTADVSSKCFYHFSK